MTANTAYVAGTMSSREAANRRSMGLGDLLTAITKRLGMTPCGACQQRAIVMNRWMPNLFRRSLSAPKNCRTYAGRYAGFGSQQCVTAAESFTPDSSVVEQCCNGW